MASSMGPGKMVTDGLVLHLDAGNNKSYPGSGNSWFDLVTTSVSGTLLNGPIFTTDGNGGVAFDGTNDYVSSSKIFDATDGLTINVWCKQTSSTVGSIGIVGNVETPSQNGYVMGIFSGTPTRVYFSPTPGIGVYESSDVTINQIVCYTGTYDKSSVKIFRNGILSNISSSTVNFTGSGMPIQVGRWYANYAPDYYWKGNIYGVQIYNRALSANEVFQNYEATRERFNRPTIVTDDDARNFLNSANISSETQQRAVNDLVVDMKNVGLWGKMKAIYPFVGGTAASHKWNLKDPRDVDAAFRLTFSGGWTHSSTGALPNGTNGYADTYLIPSSSMTNNSTHISYYSRTNNSQGSAEIISTKNSAGQTGILLIHIKWPDPNTFYTDHYNNGTNRISTTNTDSRGFYISSRVSSTSLKAYKNGNQIGSTNTNVSADFTTLAKSITLAGETYYNNVYSSKQVGFATIGDGLTDTDAANLYTIVQKYQTTLGRQV